MAHSVVRLSARAAVAALSLIVLYPQAWTAPALAAGALDAPSTAIAVDAADTVAPTVPINFRVVNRTKGNLITLGWDASRDDVGVAGYSLYRDGRWMGTLYAAGVEIIGLVFYDRLGGRIKSAVTYDLYAFDAAGNRSEPASLVVTP